jgi:2-keto-4-pentenoate hydratase/2-oxohepta-3-ene-1,7-dioic acid hydratase in catechol pathway
MKIVRFNGGRIGVVKGENIVDVTDALGVDPAAWPPIAMVNVIADYERKLKNLDVGSLNATIPFASAKLETPVPWPNKVIAFPVNYHKHAVEMNSPDSYRANTQGFFLKPCSSLSGASDPIVLPDLPGREIHHECEIAIVIGKEGRMISEKDAYDHIFGYACLLDIVVRGSEERVMRKAYDTFCPVGPYITTKDEIPDPRAIGMKLWVNDELRQHANTRDLVVDIPGMIAMASSVMTLYPGDIIASGTPEGVGPIVAGDKVRIAIENVGEMTVDVVGNGGGYTPVFVDKRTTVKS